MIYEISRTRSWESSWGHCLTLKVTWWRQTSGWKKHWTDSGRSWGRPGPRLRGASTRPRGFLNLQSAKLYSQLQRTLFFLLCIYPPPGRWRTGGWSGWRRSTSCRSERPSCSRNTLRPKRNCRGRPWPRRRYRCSLQFVKMHHDTVWFRFLKRFVCASYFIVLRAGSQLIDSVLVLLHRFYTSTCNSKMVMRDTSFFFVYREKRWQRTKRRDCRTRSSCWRPSSRSWNWKLLQPRSKLQILSFHEWNMQFTSETLHLCSFCEILNKSEVPWTLCLLLFKTLIIHAR